MVASLPFGVTKVTWGREDATHQMVKVGHEKGAAGPEILKIVTVWGVYAYNVGRAAYKVGSCKLLKSLFFFSLPYLSYLLC